MPSIIKAEQEKSDQIADEMGLCECVEAERYEDSEGRLQRVRRLPAKWSPSRASRPTRKAGHVCDASRRGEKIEISNQVRDY